MRDFAIYGIGVLTEPDFINKESQFVNGHESHNIILCNDIENTSILEITFKKDFFDLIKRNLMDYYISKELKSKANFYTFHIEGVEIYKCVNKNYRDYNARFVSRIE